MTAALKLTWTSIKQTRCPSALLEMEYYSEISLHCPSVREIDSIPLQADLLHVQDPLFLTQSEHRRCPHHHCPPNFARSLLRFHVLLPKSRSRGLLRKETVFSSLEDRHIHEVQHLL